MRQKEKKKTLPLYAFLITIIKSDLHCEASALMALPRHVVCVAITVDVYDAPVKAPVTAQLETRPRKLPV